MITISKTSAALALVSVALVLWIIYTSVGDKTHGDYYALGTRIDSVVAQQSKLLQKINTLENRVNYASNGGLSDNSDMATSNYADGDANLRSLEERVAHLNQWVADLEYELETIGRNGVARQTSNQGSTESSVKDRIEAALEQANRKEIREEERFYALQEELNQESVDQGWAQQAEADIEHAFSRNEMQAASLLSTDCRETLCEIRYTLNTDSSDAASMVSLELPAVLAKSFSHMRMARDGYGDSQVHVVFARKR